METVLFYTHPSCLVHDAGMGHPERRLRLERVLERVDAMDAPWLSRREAPPASIEQIGGAHALAYVENVIAAEPAEPGERARLDPDTSLVRGSIEAGRRASGGAIAAIEALAGGEARRAFVAMRPPGHHAERDVAMGFCFFHHAAIAARHARAVLGVERIAILDFDVHHGNGTQAIFWDDRSVFFGSSHQYPFYPGTGARSERGAFDQICNVPLAAGEGGAAFRAAWEETILPAAEAFAPELIVISAGFDAHRADPLGGLAVDFDDFAHVTRAILALAERSAKGRVASVLEGGYDPDVLARCVAEHLEVLAGATLQEGDR